MATDLHDILPCITAGGSEISHQYLVYFPGKIMNFTEEQPGEERISAGASAPRKLRRERTTRRDRTTE